MSKIQVIPVTEAPTVGDVEMMSGIRSKESAETWGATHGYPTVYWWSKRERVYGAKRTRIDLEALKLKEKSAQLVRFSERGQGLVIWVLFLLFLAMVGIAFVNAGGG